MIEAPGIVNNAHLNGEKAAVELFSRIKEPYVLQKELYHNFPQMSSMNLAAANL